jgi:hypothetical protein
MKPTKNRVFCFDCGKHKMLFESENKANRFIQFNSEEIESENGYAPNRSYYCIACAGWHVTHKQDNIVEQSRTERVLKQYDQYKQERKERQRLAQIKAKDIQQELQRIFDSVEKLMALIETAIGQGNIEECSKPLNNAFEELEKTNAFAGSKKRKKKLLNGLKILEQEIISLK